MTRPKADQLHTILAQGRFDRAVTILERLDPTVAADTFINLPFEEQQVLFGRLPAEVAAKLAPIFPYYDTFVLLHTLSADRMREVVSKMHPMERTTFLDELPETAWQQITNELAEGHLAAGLEELSLDTEQRITPPVQPVIEARGIEKSFQRPGGGQLQIIAPISLSVEPGVIIALLGPSGSGKSTLLRMLSGLTVPSAGEILWHGKPLGESSPNAAIVFQSFALFPWLTVLANVEAPLEALGLKPLIRHLRAMRALLCSTAVAHWTRRT